MSPTEQLVARVAIAVPIPQLFDYACENLSRSDIGRCVRVPYGRGEKNGLIVEVVPAGQAGHDALKPVLHVQRDVPPLPADWLALVSFVARYYHEPLGEVVALALPPGLRRSDAVESAAAGAADRPPHESAGAPAPTEDQQAAVERVAEGFGRFACWLLQGVTGSGKTEVYLRLAERALAQGRQVLMLVPEIALTPQLEA